MPFHYDVTVAWGDCDEAGIVFYPNDFYWFDSAFQALLRAGPQPEEHPDAVRGARHAHRRGRRQISRARHL
jgi:acyl-CoA thioesterase FadM